MSRCASRERTVVRVFMIQLGWPWRRRRAERAYGRGYRYLRGDGVPHDPVAIKVEAYNYLEHGYVEGHLRVLSADAFTTSDDDKAMPVRPYYKGYVTLDHVGLHDVPSDFQLMQGTPVTADIQVGKRTLLSYLVRGALRSVDESMREP